MQDGEGLECCKQRLMGETDGISEDQNVNRTADSKDFSRSFRGEGDSIKVGLEVIHVTFWQRIYCLYPET